MKLVIRIADAQALGDYDPRARAQELKRSETLERLSYDQHIAAADRSAWIVDDNMARDIVTSSHDTLLFVPVTDAQVAEIRARHFEK